MQRDWVLILGASSGFGAAAALAFAQEGHNILGVHLDRSSTRPIVDALQTNIRSKGVHCHFFNVNAADDKKRVETLEEVKQLLAEHGGQVQVLIHSLAFGSLLPFVGSDQERGLRPKQMTMTLEVMGHSLVWWSRDLVRQGLMRKGGRIFAMTSSGSHTAFHAYGAVGAAKAALESHIRYLAMELAPRQITANAILAGVTDTPALRKIPGHEALIENASKRNPSQRLTTCEDVAACLVTLSGQGTHWMTGNTLRVDGGENICS